MSKRTTMEESPEKPQAALTRVKKAIGDNCACYVLITCSKPTENGKMEVEMDFDGDEELAAFLVENASQVFDQRFIAKKLT